MGVALAAWTAPEENLWLSAIGAELVRMGVAERPAPGTPGPFAFGGEGTIGELLEGAGFDDVEVEALDFAFRFESLDAHFDQAVTLSTSLRAQLAALTPAQHTALRDAVDERLGPFAGEDGSVAIPARTWVAAAQA